MRKINAALTAAILVLFVIHMIWGGLELTGMTKGGNSLFSALSFLLIVLILAHTVKGKGVSFMEGQAGWHGKAIDKDSYDRAMAELGGAI